MWRYIGATRPMFLTVSVVGCGIGFSIAFAQSGTLPWGACALAVIIAVAGQGSANVINDLADAENGTDAINTDRISPFTGGSRFLQDGVLSLQQVRILAVVTIGLVVIAGIGLLTHLRAWELAWVGVAAMAIGWAYSAPPFQLMSRGVWGEAAIVAAWALIVVGSSMLSTHQVSAMAMTLGLAYGAMVANILYANQIPDIRADRSVGKFTLAVQVPRQRLWVPYVGFLLAAYAGLFFSMGTLGVSPWILLGAVSLPLSYRAVNILKRGRFERMVMTRALQATILSAHVFGVGVAVGLLI